MAAKADRKLAAILAADVAGYSRLMAGDEAGTIEALTRSRAIFSAIIQDHNGRIANTAGDSIVADFQVAADAVRCAVSAQARLRAENESVPEDRQIRFRMGVHLGDVVRQGDDILGDGVNIAARLESIALPGTVVISGSLYDVVDGKVPFQFVDLGQKQLKNIGRPVRAYQVLTEESLKRPIRFWSFSTDSGRPSIAVLPFENLTGEAEPGYFADGLVEDIITALSHNPMLVVIARHSSFAYKGRSPNIQQVGRELGVRYALEGSVRKWGEKLRITGQLNDTETGAHVWADRFDGLAADVFDLQDAITERVVGALDGEVRVSEIKRQRRRPTNDLTAYDSLIRGLGCFYEHTPESTAQALDHFIQAVKLDPSCAVAWGYGGATLLLRRTLGCIQNIAENARECLEYCHQAILRGTDDAEALSLAALVQVCLGHELVRSTGLAERSIALNSNSPFGWYAIGLAKLAAGHANEAVTAIGRGIRLNPRDPAGYAYLGSYALALFVLKNYSEAVKHAERALAVRPTWAPALRIKAASLAKLDMTEEARLALLHARKIDPHGSSSLAARMIQLPSGDLDNYISALKLAGLDE
ncbi:adenylate/guanylate cyclase domain-containing protein [Bradyrhizobium sp. 179]|uniref:adenylate/guanylate cyclase domain-containing protein n=1 Tax=Bradyrhizobium sp. 179 TaxID=2782648 RepID=UPI001FF7B8AD|nr:adenylate/guanylate cyclase domain-containing protein [Bradyrhizobium sp. 179]MCK1541619.1 adenylate/guanylate cyclase domain-containing protein [Bradyrhizobium sp. 179]